MFTGIARGCGIVEGLVRGKRAARLEVALPTGFPSVKIGGSVSVDGACLTVVKKKKHILFFDVIPETMRRTNFSRLKKGTRVNVEPALRWNDRIEGHFVQGHVDAVGTVKKIIRQEPGFCFEIKYPVKLKSFILEKGSIAVNGVSLTVGAVHKNFFRLYLIPHTINLTNFNRLKAGDRVNLETDILIKTTK